MSSVSPKHKSLNKILRLESVNGFQDSTVIGGLDRFLQRWADKLKPDLGEFKSYSVLTPQERQEWANNVMAKLEAKSHADPDKLTHKRSPNESTRPNTAALNKRKGKPPPKLSLSDDVIRLKGVSKRNLSKLKRLGVDKVGDLLYLFPHRHNDFANVRKVFELEPGQQQTVRVSVWEASETRSGPRRRSTQAVLGDDTGNVRAIWFNQPWIARNLKSVTEIMVSGKVSLIRGQMVFQSPEYEILEGQEQLVHTGRLIPVYPSTEGMPQRTLRRLVKQGLDNCISQVNDFLPNTLIHRAGLGGLQNAISQFHYPDSNSDWKSSRRRLAFDELFLLQLAVLHRKMQWQGQNPGIPLKVDPIRLNTFLETLPFSLTPSQSTVTHEIMEDLKKDIPMSRLLQGDVGSGKTIVAAAALLMTAFNGRQGALMVPTEILAEQHFINISRLLSGISHATREKNLMSVQLDNLPGPISIGLLLGSLTKRAKDDLRQRIYRGQVDIIIGTQALIQDSVEIPDLALVVVDEQHRFGVMQRASLRKKGPRPHLLAMSATPIPRSLALTLYGDLDISIIDELPPGRHKIRNRLVDPDKREAAYGFVRKEVQAGRQAFIVCPLVEESEAIQSRAAIKEHKRLSDLVFPELRLGLLHGRMALSEKVEIMELFQRGELDILVSTPVVEIGIDVSNATVMLIDGADRFGLSQLHQFRGRVGRGPHQSYCLLLADSPGEEARNRLKIVERVHDGFQLAEEDLRLRGPGDYMGTRQSGLPDLRVANLTDQDILSLARLEATRLLGSDPHLSKEENSALKIRLVRYSENLTDEQS